MNILKALGIAIFTVGADLIVWFIISFGTTPTQFAAAPTSLPLTTPTANEPITPTSDPDWWVRVQTEEANYDNLPSTPLPLVAIVLTPEQSKLAQELALSDTRLKTERIDLEVWQQPYAYDDDSYGNCDNFKKHPCSIVTFYNAKLNHFYMVIVDLAESKIIDVIKSSGFPGPNSEILSGAENIALHAPQVREIFTEFYKTDSPLHVSFREQFYGEGCDKDINICIAIQVSPEDTSKGVLVIVRISDDQIIAIYGAGGRDFVEEPVKNP